MCIGLAAVKRAQFGCLAKACDPFDPAGVKTDHINGASFQNSLDTTGVPLPLTLGNPDARCRTQGAVTRGGSVDLNRFRVFSKWLSSSVTPPVRASANLSRPDRGFSRQAMSVTGGCCRSLNIGQIPVRDSVTLA